MPGKYSPKQMKIAKMSKPKNKLTGADFKKLAMLKRKRSLKQRRFRWQVQHSYANS